MRQMKARAKCRPKTTRRETGSREQQKDTTPVVLAGGATQARDLPIEGRELNGVHFAMEFLTQQNRVNEGDTVPNQITAKGKRVIILGGGDTGSDCLGTSNRHGAISVHQFELMPKPPSERNEEMPWPYWPMILRTSSPQEEGVERDYSVNTVRLTGDAQGNVKQLHGVRLTWVMAEQTVAARESPGPHFTLEATWSCSRCGLRYEKKPLQARFDDRPR